MQTINADIRSGNFQPVYLLYGEEAYLRRSYRDRLREAIVGDDTMNYTYYEGKDVPIPDLISTAETMPFFADRRLIIVEKSGLFRREAGVLADYLERLPETTHIVFVEEEVDKRNKLYKRVKAKGCITECVRQTGAELSRWAARGFAFYGKKITPAVMELFLERTGEDMENIRREMDKLTAYVGDREEITAEDVEAITTPQLQNRVFEMIDRVTAGKTKEALALYADLLALKEPPMRILFLITRQFHSLLQVKALAGQGLPDSEIASRCGMRPFAVKRSRRQAERFTSEQLTRFVREAVELEEDVKQGRLRDQIAVELMIVRFSEAAA